MKNPSLYFDLLKAQRDRSKLVQVQRTVTRRGKTFMQNFWVSPSEVKKTDKVIGGLQNLIPTKGSVPKPPKGQYDQKYFDSISQDKNDRSEAVAYLKECGCEWKENSNPGINWMHALHARNVKFGAPASQTGKSTAQPQNAQSQANSQAKTANATVQPTVNTIAAMGMLDSKTMAEFSSCSNGKEKVVVLKKKLGQDGCIEFAKKCGVTWNENPNKGINSMRMSMALAAALDSAAGVQVNPNGKVGAPIGNDNAKKDGVTADNQTPPEPKVEPDTIEIKDSMVQREKNIAELLNKCTSVDDLKLFAKTGIVAEDDTARDFVRNQLYKAYFEEQRNSSTRWTKINHVGSKEFGKASIDSLTGAYRGIPKKLMRKGLEILSDERQQFNIPALLYPREVINVVNSRGGSSKNNSTPYRSSSSYNSFSLQRILTQMDVFSHMTTDSQSSQGYTGWDLEKSQKRHSDYKDSKGVSSIINHIADKDPTVRVEADKMLQEYEELSKLCYHNDNMLNDVCTHSFDRLKETSEENKNGGWSQTTLDAVAKATPILKRIQDTYGLTDRELEYSMSRIWSWSNTEGQLQKERTSGGYGWDLVKDSSGEPVTLKSLFEKEPDGSKIWKDLALDESGSSEVVALCKAYLTTGKSFEEMTEDDNLEYGVRNAVERRDRARALSQLSAGRYEKIRVQLMKLSGKKVQKYDENTGTYSDVDISLWNTDDWEDYDKENTRYIREWNGDKPKYLDVSDGENEARDTILANMKYSLDNLAMLEAITLNVDVDVPQSKANENGQKMENSFSYFRSSQTQSAKHGQNIKYCYSTSTVVTPSEANEKIKEQIENTPVLTTKQLSDMRKFTQAQGQASGSSEMENNILKARYYAIASEENIDGHKGTPIHDVIYQQVNSIARYLPQMKNTRVKTDEQVSQIVADKMGYTPYISPEDRAAAAAPALSSELRQWREEALSKAHCSLKTSDAQEREKIEKRVKNDWDKGQRSSSGSRLYGHVSFEGHGVYQINNSTASDTFEKASEKVKKDKYDNSQKRVRQGKGEYREYNDKVVSLFHGTDFRGACGIIGVDGQFRAPKDHMDAARNGQKFAGGMLGPGVYLAELAGKSAGYLGDWGSGYDGKRGALLICDAILGDTLVTPEFAEENRQFMDMDTIYMKQGAQLSGSRTLRADEYCLRRNDIVAPRYLIDSETHRRSV